MRKIITLIIMLIIGLGASMYMHAQESQPTKKELKAQKKALAEAEANARYEVALNAIKEGAFVLEVDKVTLKWGQFIYVNSYTNFIMVNGDEATVQLAFSTTRLGANGLGGITVDGTISNPKIEISKKGRVHYSFSVQGVGISASINLTLDEGGNMAEADVNPNFNSNRTSMSGTIVPLEESAVFKGQSL